MASQKQEPLTLKESKIVSVAYEDAKRYIDEKLKSVNAVIIGVVIVVSLAFILMILDQFRFNSVTYREYSQKTETYNLLFEENKKNQEIIIENQKFIKQLLEEKK